MYHLWTDGSRYPESKYGGWAYRLQLSASKICDEGTSPINDNNYLEVLAVIKGLEVLGEKSVEVTVHTDSLFVIRLWTEGRNVYVTRKQRSRKKTDIRERFFDLVSKHRLTFQQVLPGQHPPEHSDCHHRAREAVKNHHARVQQIHQS